MKHRNASYEPKSASTNTLEDAGIRYRRAIAPVSEWLEEVDRCIAARLQDPLAQRVAYLISAGGKRLRPALVLLSGRFGTAPNREGLIRSAAALELIHTATLIHDDIIDVSELRRQQPTFHTLWGTERAVLTGDYLYATAFKLLADIEDPRISQWVAEVCQRLSLGELREVEARCRLDLSEENYFAIIRDKTASLIEACCRIGARLGGYSDEAVESFGVYGDRFGLAFQIADDCLDLSGDPEELGKSILADLDKGILSLPILYLIEKMEVKERDELFAPLAELSDGKPQARIPEADLLREVAQRAIGAGALERAQIKAAALAAEGQEALNSFAPEALLESYRELAEYVIERRN